MSGYPTISARLGSAPVVPTGPSALPRTFGRLAFPPLWTCVRGALYPADPSGRPLTSPDMTA